MYGRKNIKNDTAVSFGLPLLNFVTVKDAPDATKSLTETKVGSKNRNVCFVCYINDFEGTDVGAI